MSGKTANMTATAVVRPLVLDPDRRTMIISDIHGNLPFLKGLLRKVGYTKDDVLIILEHRLFRPGQLRGRDPLLPAWELAG